MDRVICSYVDHFTTFCCCFLAYNNNNKNPFRELVPLAQSSPALLNSIAAVAAVHLARNEGEHQLNAQKYYAAAVQQLNTSLSDPNFARSDSALGACLMLCVYKVKTLNVGFRGLVAYILQILNSGDWLKHLQGARALILSRSSLKPTNYLIFFLSLLDVSGSLTAGGSHLFQGNYWPRDSSFDNYIGKLRSTIPYSPAYDSDGVSSLPTVIYNY
jgi:hypothetical protein